MSDLFRIVKTLAKQHRRKSAAPSSPWELILWENVAYLADDASRKQAFELLKTSVGLSAAKIAAAPESKLLAVTKAGIVAEGQAAKLRRCATLALEEFNGDVDAVLKLPLKDAMRGLRKFPGIGVPGAEKILLLCGAHPIFTVESNGLRVLQRLGLAREHSNYAASYTAMQKAVGPQPRKQIQKLAQAFHILRLHGQLTCKRSLPLCDTCPLVRNCPSAV
jgi:endonuclease III